MHVTAKFEITGWDQSTYDEPAEGPPLGEATITKTYSGPLDGVAQVRMLACQTGENPTDGAGYLAQERVTGTLDGRSGTFVLQHGACGGPEGTEQYGFIVPGSGTGQLAALSGTCRVRHGELTLEYQLG